MASPKKRLESEESSSAQLELIKSSSHNPFWSSSLFNEVYLLNDVPSKYKEKWELDEVGPFYMFCNSFRNLVEELKGEDLDSWSERNTINRLIKPILKMLGYADNCSANQEPWAEDEPFTVTESGEPKTYKPDFIIVNDPRELKYIERKKGQEKLDEAKSTVILPIEAKYWGRIDDERLSASEDSKRADKREKSDPTRSLDFDGQCLKYMEILNKEYGILTDGKTWRLYHGELSRGTFRRCFQFNLGNLMKHVGAGLEMSGREYQIFLDNAKYFFHIFSKEALTAKDGDRRFVDDLAEYSKKYVSQIEEDLQKRFVTAMTVACNGFERATRIEKTSLDLQSIRNISESHLFNILFVRYCESRNILPLKQSPEYRKISISNILDKLEYFDPEKEADNLNQPLLTRMFSKDFRYDPNGTELFDRLLKLTSMVQEGTNPEVDGFEVVGFRESIFSRDEWKISKKLKLSNAEMIQILFCLGYSESDVKGRKYQQIPYNFFSPRQLGSIYESFLEFKIAKAETDLAFVNRQWKPANLNHEKFRTARYPTSKKGELYFTPDNEDRKATGAYYTPDEVVRCIVSSTISPILKQKSAAEILKIKICDPAMGSGHFLAGALNFLAESYLAAIEEESGDQAFSLVDAKREVLHNCIFGVDINDRAVKLARMSLWLESAAAGKRLEHLEDQLKAGDSTVSFEWKKEFHDIFSAGGFDAIVGNPPYASAPTMVARDKQSRNKIEATKRYRTLTFKWDLYVVFIELATQISKKQGRVGLIVPFAVLSQKYAIELRKLILDECSLESVVDLSNEKVFEDATVMTAILIFSNQASTADFSVRQGLMGEITLMSRSEINSVDAEIRTNVDTDSKAIADKILAAGKPIEHYYFCSVGCVPHSEKENKSKEFYIHDKKQSGFKPYIEAKDFERYLTPVKTRWLNYKYDVVRRPGLPELLDSPKVLVKLVVGKKGFSAANDEVGVYTDHSLAGLGRKCDLPKITSRSGIAFSKEEIEDSKKLSNKYLTLLITSHLMYFVYRVAWDSSLNLSINDLKSLPVIVPTAAELKGFDKLYDQISKALSNGKPIEGLTEDVNAKVFDLYGVSAKDRAKILGAVASPKKAGKKAA